MAALNKRLAAAGRALARLQEITQKDELSEIERDGFIQRFEFSFEILWKCGREYLLSVHGLEAASPKKVIRLLRETGLFNDQEAQAALEMVDDRNMTVHTYDEVFAREMIQRIYRYAPLLEEWYRRMMASGRDGGR